MKRMTAQFKILSNWVGIETTQNIFESLFRKSPRLTHVNLLKQETTNILFVELKSESTPKDLIPIFESVAGDANLEFIAVGWGWMISDNIYNIYTQEHVPHDNSETKRYTVQPSLVVYNILLLTLIISLATFTYRSIMGNPTVIIYWVGFAFAIALVFIVLFQTREVICDRERFIIKYWLPFKRIIPWGDVISMQVRMVRGFVCTVKVRKGFRIDFLVGKYFGMKDAEHLVETIARRSNLRIVEGFEWDNSRYNRYDA
jgi:hypothetical protein